MVSPRRTTSALSLVPEERFKMTPSSTKSCESLYSNTSSSKGSATVLYRRKTPPMGGGHRQPALIPATTEVRQRVLSARRLRMKTYQNQLADAQQTIAELAHENRILRTLHKRQDSALAKYESTNAELPQLLHSHAEELRVWQTKYRNLQALAKELEQKLKQKEAVILSLSDQNKYYSQLNKDKNLDERQRLSEKVQALEQRLQEKDNDMKLLARKVQLEAKNFKKQLQAEQKKSKDILTKLEKSRLELSGYRKLDELNLTDKFSSVPARRKLNSSSDLEPMPGRERELEKPLEKPDYVENSTAEEDTDYLGSSRSAKSNAVSKLDMNSTRTIRKLNPAAASPRKQHHQHQPPRRIDRGDGDAASLSAIASKPTVSRTEPSKESQSSTASPEYEDDYEPAEDAEEEEEPAAEEAADEEDDDGPDNEDAEGELEEDEDDEEDAENEADEETDIIATVKTSTKMKEDICSIRKQISDDYKEREAFLDTFCRQATSNALREEQPKRNSISMGHTVPGNRKHKLLAALKAIDANNSED